MNIEEPRYFSWIKVNEIAGCNHPKSNAELQWLKNQDIKHILCLSKVSFFSKAFSNYKISKGLLHCFQDHYPNGAEIVGFQVEMIPINEFEGPPENVMKQLLSYLTNVRSKREVSNEQTYQVLEAILANCKTF